MKILISSVIIRERQRSIGPIAVAELATSMAEVGLIQAIGVNERNELIWGRHRLAAAVSLGWTEIEAVQREGLTPVEEQLIELYEDIKRKDRDWKEKCTAIAKIHRMQSADKGDWTVRQTSELTKLGLTSVKYMLQVAKALEQGVPAVVNADSYTDAFKELVKIERDAATAELERRRQRMAEVVIKRVLSDDVVPVLGLHAAEDEETEPEPGQALTPFEETSTVTIQLHGQNIQLDQTTSIEQKLIIVYKQPIPILPRIRRMLAPNGVIVFFYDSPAAWDNLVMSAEDAGLYPMPWPLIWSKGVVGVKLPFPFSPTYGIAIVMMKTEPLKDAPAETSPAFSVINAPPTGPGLPMNVVSYILSALSNDGDKVTILGTIDPVDVAAYGRIPIWYEPDPAKFKEQQDAMENYYMDNVPGAKVVR